MSALKRIAHGFTLVEILIVVVILGILTAIVIPQFVSASENAKQSDLKTQMQAVRSQLELYKIQHNDNYPTLAQMFGNLTVSTDAAGNTSGTLFGPYLQKPPINPFTPGTNGAELATAAASTVGWVFNATSGVFQASLSAAQASDLTLDTADYLTY